MKKEQKLPKWFDGELYSKGALVQNRFGYGEIELNAMELSMYDLIMGAELLGQYKDVQRGCEWFRTNNPKAYMVLLD